MLNQQFQECFLAVAIDPPTRTISAGKIEIGAFCTYPQSYMTPDEPVSEYQTIPLNKIEDFVVHCKQVQVEESQLSRMSRDSSKITVEQVHNLMSQVVNSVRFNSVQNSIRAMQSSDVLFCSEPTIESSISCLVSQASICLRGCCCLGMFLRATVRRVLFSLIVY